MLVNRVNPLPGLLKGEPQDHQRSESLAGQWDLNFYTALLSYVLSLSPQLNYELLEDRENLLYIFCHSQG